METYNVTDYRRHENGVHVWTIDWTEPVEHDMASAMLQCHGETGDLYLTTAGSLVVAVS
uniref:Uncharacterized protein n=1 Tax=viral metagenome TaxID=1070528 RepID=A0A6M3LVS3_9ZZZZ